jgi:hypothetical protein
MTHDEHPASPRPKPKRGWLPFGLALLAVVGLGGLGYLGYRLFFDRVRPRLTLKGHADAVLALAYSPDGRLLASGSTDGAVKIWDVASGREQVVLRGHTEPVLAVVFSADGKTLASISKDGSASLWDVATGNERPLLQEPARPVICATFSPDGRWMAAGGEDANVRVWDLATGKVRATIPHARIYCLALGPDGNTLAFANHSGLGLLVWDVVAGKERARFQEDDITSLTFAADGKTLASAEEHGSIKLRDMPAGTPRTLLQPEWRAYFPASLAFTPDGKMLAVSGGKYVTLWDLDTEKERTPVEAHSSLVNAVTFSPDGRELASASSDGTIELWDLAAIPRKPLPEGVFSGPAPRVFDGPSENLRQTVIVPTLDTPVPESKSAVWCASLQIAWNRIRTDITKGPVQVGGAEDLAGRLNRAEQSEADLVPGSYYVAAGLIKDGIADIIRKDMAAQFPGVPAPDLRDLQDLPVPVLAAFAYLRASVRYESEFFDNPEGLKFTDPAGKESRVRAFGIRESEKHMAAGYRSQVKVLFRQGREFALDLSENSQPNQVVVAKVPWQGTLAETLAYVQGKAAVSPPGRLGTQSVLLVPNVDFRVEHHFRELEGHGIKNPPLKGWEIVRALQWIQFRLDRKGADLESGMDMRAVGDGHDDDPNYFEFDRPFLIYLKKRDAKHPFFVLWVDNAELLCK